MREIKFRAWNRHSARMLHVMDLPNNWHGDNLAMICGFPKYFEVMQFTGLKDKNGKEIYEGDIVKSSLDDIYLVEWDEYLTGFNPFIMGVETGQILASDPTEVIGNIYENPELLK